MAEEVKSEVKEQPPLKKNFFKSISFKCIIVLLAIVLVCGIILTICNSLFYVSDAERLQRAISKVYGYEMEVTVVEFTDDEDSYEFTDGKATILAAYEDENGDYLISSKGTGGFGGTVTCWVLVGVSEGSVTGVKQVVINTSDGETLLNSIDFLDTYADAQYTDGFTYTTSGGFVTSGATMSSKAINNAVNGAVSFVNVVCLGKEDQTVIEETLSTGATRSNELCAYACMFAIANYDSCISNTAVSSSFEYTTYIDVANTSYTLSGTTVTYSVTTTANSPANAFVLEISVGADKTVASFEIKTNGSTTGYGTDYSTKMYDTSKFVGMSLSDLTTLTGGAE